MRFLIYILSGLIFLIITTKVNGQGEDLENDSISENILLKQEFTGGITIHNLGFGLQFRRGWNKSYFKSRILELEVVNMNNPKQVRMINSDYFNAKSYVYGKLNQVYILRAGYGFKKLLNRKPYWGGVELRLLYMGGLSVAFAKPIYLYFWDDLHTTLKEEKYNPDNTLHNRNYIYGRAPFMSGFNEIKIYPGVYAKGGLNFEFGEYNTRIRALEAGIVAEYFPVAIPIMAFYSAQNFFLTFYLNFQIGKRYNK